MSYYFNGIFTNSIDNKISETAKQRWTFIKTKLIDKPFSGLAMVGHDIHYSNDVSELEQDEEDNFRLEKELIDFSKLFPTDLFIHVVADCHGGTCWYGGFACKNGEIIIDNREEHSETFSQDFQSEKLKQLIRAFGVELDQRGLFEPFRRGYFEDNPKNIRQTIVETATNDKPWWKFWD